MINGWLLRFGAARGGEMRFPLKELTKVFLVASDGLYVRLKVPFIESKPSKPNQANWDN